MKGKVEKKSGTAIPMAVTAALAVLGLSVGVDVQGAVSGAEEVNKSGMGNFQIEVGGAASKENAIKRGLGAGQGKIESQQNKAMGALQQKVAPQSQRNLPAMQNKAMGTLQHKISPADQGKIPSTQSKAGGVSK